ncbi:hypothetical protein [Bradymonas sediminis]|uniref:Uncharacterized protein n=1 Tax=Bradymonas sediminis TaxID=1548548 RepID=A0A2Z4FR71_9DELT|nr:hypothetical protein [Bradymonas sediminis]AWV91194.1 hypothetical protein DN745_18425 [Bradymonas sediminis]TDP73758.1 hypothetical protein DFR33_10590 [Bradymonas sediminis]
MLKLSSKTALLAALLLTLVGGCDANEFSDAPKVSAPAPGEVSAQGAPAQNLNAGARAPGSAGPLKPGATANDLPSDHPPMMPGMKGGGAQGSTPAVPNPAAAGTMTPEQFGKVGPIRWSAPDNWLAVKPASPMRLAEYHLLGADGTEPAVMSIFYFGQGGGGAIQMNLDRWVKQFKSVTGEPQQSVEEVAGMKVHRIAVEGTFEVDAAMGGGTARADFGLLGAIAESPAGNYFFKLTGPTETIAKHKGGFDGFVKSFKPAPEEK